MKIAVVGGGIYGVTVAVQLGRAGFTVDLFERHHDLLQAASGINQYRLHRGYHYPRSSETILSSLAAEPLFRKEFSAAVIDDVDHYYCIAKEKSFVSSKRYLEICRAHNLEFKEVELPLINRSAVALCLQVKESLLDPEKLRKLCYKRLTTAQVRLHLGVKVTESDLDHYDHVIICAYANTNALLKRFPGLQQDYQFELCEKPVITLPADFARKSIVILDGPFTCVDPLGRGSYHVIGNVVHAIHSTNIGKEPQIPRSFLPLLNKGVIKHPSITNFSKFIESAKYFMPGVGVAKHVGSMFTIRTVLPNVEKTDARPTLVQVINERTIRVFSSKIGNCVTASLEVLGLIKKLSH